MSIVIFDAPQSVEDDPIDVELQQEAVESVRDGLYVADTELTTEITKQTGDPLQITDQPEAQPPQIVSSEYYGSERSEEADLLDQIWNAERDCRKAEARVELLKNELKEAKSQYEQCVIRLREIISDSSGHDAARTTKVICEPTTHSWTCKVVESPASVTSEAIPAADETKQAESEMTAPLAWRAVPLSELFREPIKGLGAKKQEAMIDLCPTLGDLEDLMSTVGKAAAQFHELLPKGIGLETASTIEERLLDWIARNPQACDDDQIPVLTLQTRADQLCDDPAGFIHRHHGGNGYWQSGFDSFRNGATLDECPWTAGVEQDDWLRGWLRAQANCANAKEDCAADGEAMTLEDDEPQTAEIAVNVKPKKLTPRVLHASSLDDL